MGARNTTKNPDAAREAISRRTFLCSAGAAVAGVASVAPVGLGGDDGGVMPEQLSVPFEHTGKTWYRLPSLLVSSKATVLAACQKRKGGSGDWAESALVLRRSFDGGRTWQGEQVLYEEEGECTFNGNLIEDRRTGRIFAFFIAFPKAAGPAWFDEAWMPAGGGFSFVSSDDDGANWSERVDHIPGPNADGWRGGASYNNTRGVQISQGPHAGRLVAAARVFKRGVHEDRAKGGLVYSDDHGAHWRVGAVGLPDQGSINGEVTLCEDAGGEIYVNFRNRRAGPRLYGRSRDGGASFYEEGECQGVANHACHAGLDSFPADGQKRRLLLSFPDPGRRNLRWYVSVDGGRRFMDEGLIKAGPAAYSDLAVLDTDTAGVLWEGGPAARYEQIGFTRLSLGQLQRRGGG